MSDSETTEDVSQNSPDEDQTASKQNASLLPVIVVISLLLALASAGGTGYIWFNGQQQQLTQSQLIGTLNKELTSLQQEQQNSKQTQAAAQTALTQQQQEISQRLTKIKERLGRNSYDWAVSEIRYTLRQANMRLQLFKDKDTALVALQLADQQLARLNAPALHKLRSTVNKEIAALRAVKVTDIEGVSLTLSALAEQIKKLSVIKRDRNQKVKTEQPNKTTSDEDIVNWQKHADAVWSEMKTLVTIRRTDKKIIPLLGEQEAQQLKLAMGLKIEITRLALLQRNTMLFKASLQETNDWLAEYFNAEQPAVAAIATQLQELKQLQLEPNYPDISQSLAMLEQQQNGSSLIKKKSATKVKETQTK